MEAKQKKRSKLRDFILGRCRSAPHSSIIFSHNKGAAIADAKDLKNIPVAIHLGFVHVFYRTLFFITKLLPVSKIKISNMCMLNA
jgi:hypothetical protein